ncbi:MAG: mannose-1-phosphate guanylyltransferase/mannose-6-phosphate isomerase [Lautropia sp.]|nr:mannose-1-phosphate guanylyltransferase/mannose-6-phosphate isomerase [Lautropia sp.]
MLIPVILSGGAGTRLWPVSREGHPKPFMQLPDGESLLMKTYRRARRVAETGQILTVTNREYFFLSRDQYQLALPGEDELPAFLLEPFGRNTAPAIALAALQVAERHGPDALMLVMPADHLLTDEALFASAVEQAATLAAQGYLVTFGIRPTAPETGYGYIEAGDIIPPRSHDNPAATGSSQSLAGRHVVRFIEKPAREKAEALLAAGNFLWNSGMFCLAAQGILKALEQHAPDILQTARTCQANARQEQTSHATLIEIGADDFRQAPDISIDYAVMEKSDRVAVVPGTFGWNDIGSWDAVRSLSPADDDGNRSTGDTVFVDSHDVYVHNSEDRLVATVGLQDLLIIDTPDALLVSAADKAQQVKDVVKTLKSRKHETAQLHRTVARPWGTYTILGEGPRYKIKRIEVKPGASLSLQMHHHRNEHWIVVKGMAKVVNGDDEIFVATNESTYIPATHRHRLENPGLLPLVMIEVQSGEYLGEDDIVRFQDNYGRA